MSFLFVLFCFVLFFFGFCFCLFVCLFVFLRESPVKKNECTMMSLTTQITASGDLPHLCNSNIAT